MNPNGTDALFEIIRKELNTIIENGEKSVNESKAKKQPKNRIDETNLQKSELVSKSVNKSPRTRTQGAPNLKAAESSNAEEDNMSNQRDVDATEMSLFPRVKAGLGANIVTSADIIPKKFKTKEKDTKISEMQTKFKSTLAKEIANQTTFLDSPRTKTIDADVQRMQMELQDSYNLFQGISEKFETINFNNLQKRIKELNLTKKREVVGIERSDELKKVVEEGFKTNRLNEMTTKVGEKFNKHPGEFGNIPELSSFFQACTQLEHVLGTLKRQRTDVRELEQRMRRSAEISYNRVSHIKKQLQEEKFEKPAKVPDSYI